MSESRRSSNGGSRRAAGVRRTPAGKSARSGSAKSGAAKPGAATSGSAKGSSRTARTAGGASAGSKGTSAAAKRPTSRTSVSARHAGAAPKGAAGSRGKNAAATNFLNYPRAGKENPWRWIPSLRLVVGAIALFVLAGLGFSVWLYNDTEVPEPSVSPSAK